MEELLHQLRDGGIDFGKFYRETADDWDAMAQALYNKLGHRLQGNGDFEDVRQEMLMGISSSVEKWDPETGYGLKSFVVWNAHTNAKAWVSKQCGAYKHRVNEKPREPISASYMPIRLRAESVEDGPFGVEVYMEQISSVDADQEWFTMTRSHREVLCRTMADHVVMDRLLDVGASLGAIADSICEDKELMRKLEVSSRARAYGLVRRVTTEFANRAAAAA